MEDQIQQLRDEIDNKRTQLKGMVSEQREQQAALEAQQELSDMTPEHRAAIIQAVSVGPNGGVNGE